MDANAVRRRTLHSVSVIRHTEYSWPKSRVAEQPGCVSRHTEYSSRMSRRAEHAGERCCGKGRREIAGLAEDADARSGHACHAGNRRRRGPVDAGAQGVTRLGRKPAPWTVHAVVDPANDAKRPAQPDHADFQGKAGVAICDDAGLKAAAANCEEIVIGCHGLTLPMLCRVLAGKQDDHSIAVRDFGPAEDRLGSRAPGPVAARELRTSALLR